MSEATSREKHANGHKVTEDAIESLERFSRGARDELQRDAKAPSTRAAIAGAAVLGAALVVGLPETLLGAAAGLVVYRILQGQKRPPG